MSSASFSVLLYHHVGPPRAGTARDLTVSPRRFEGHIQWLVARGFEFVGLADLANETRLGPRSVLVTFDDGYADLAEFAFPVLEAYRLKSTVFVVTGLFGGRNTWDEARGRGGHRLLSREQIASWARRGIDFGAHGCTHADLTRVAPSDVEREVAESRRELDELLGVRAAPAFAYPYGHWNESVVACVRRQFDFAFTTEEGRNERSVDRHLLRRSMVRPYDSRVAVHARAVLGYSPFERARRALRAAARSMRRA